MFLVANFLKRAEAFFFLSLVRAVSMFSGHSPGIFPIKLLCDLFRQRGYCRDLEESTPIDEKAFQDPLWCVG